MSRVRDFIRGMGSIFNLFPPPPPPMPSDTEALRGDWEAIGRDIKYAIQQHAKQPNAASQYGLETVLMPKQGHDSGNGGAE